MSSLLLTTWAIRSHREGQGDAGLSLPPSLSHCASHLHPQPRRRKGCIRAQAKWERIPTFHLLILEPAQGLVSSQDFFCKNVALLSQKVDFLGTPQGEADGLVWSGRRTEAPNSGEVVLP